MNRSIILNLPIPPSVNGAWRNVAGKGRVKSAAYKAWSTAAGWKARAQQPGMAPLAGQIVVSIRCERPSPRADVDNRIKPILDLLTDVGLIGDDSQVVKVSCEWADVSGAVVEVSEVTP